MSRNLSWWQAFGDFAPLDERKTRPHPVEVLLWYLDRKGVKAEERPSYLMTALHIKRSSVYELLKGNGFDLLQRCRYLIDLLAIPAQLLALDAKYRNQPMWWVKLGYPFDSGEDGYPDVGQVIRYFRSRIEKCEKNGVRSLWTQADLAEALNTTEDTVSKMENNKNTTALNRISRRALLAQTFYNATQAAIVFALLGLDAQAFLPPVKQSAPTVYLSSVLEKNDLNLHKAIQQNLFQEYRIGHGQGLAGETQLWLQFIREQVIPGLQGPQIAEGLALQSLYEKHLGSLSRELSRSNDINGYLGAGVKTAQLARQYIPDNNLTMQLWGKELEVSARQHRAQALCEQGKFKEARKEADIALAMADKMPVSSVTGNVLVTAGWTYAYTTQSSTDSVKVSAFFDRAALLADNLSEGEASIFSSFDRGYVYMRQAMALLSPLIASGDTLAVLEKATLFTPSDLARRHLIINIYRAQYAINVKEYQQAAEIALEALDASQRLRSKLNFFRIQSLYDQLCKTNYKGQPLLVRLGVQLSLWKLSDE